MSDDALWYEAALLVGLTNALNVVADAPLAVLEPAQPAVSPGGPPIRYLTDIRYRADLPAIREAVFSKRLPASTLVAVSALAHPDWLIEVEAIAVV